MGTYLRYSQQNVQVIITYVGESNERRNQSQMRVKKDSVITDPTTDQTTKNDEDIGNATDEDIDELQKEVRLCGKWSKE